MQILPSPWKNSREQIQEGIAAVLPDAAAAGVKLAIEPLHPMYADTRSAINTLAQANDLAEKLNSPWLGVAVDVYHLWWDPFLEDRNRPVWQAGTSVCLSCMRLEDTNSRFANGQGTDGGRMHSGKENQGMG